MPTITYLDNSGFAVALERRLLVFDYCNDSSPERGLAGGTVSARDLARFDRADVFVSHSHADHFSPAIYRWADLTSCHIEHHISQEIDPACLGHRYAPGDVQEHEGMVVRAFGSTDIGVSFMVDVEGLRLFHAGDLNWWHWREESSAMEIEQSERDFKREMEPIIHCAKEGPVDAAFFPLDPRQRTFYDAGANYFIATVKPRYFLPMHCAVRPEVATEYARRNRIRGTQILPLAAQRGRNAQIEIQEEENP